MLSYTNFASPSPVLFLKMLGFTELLLFMVLLEDPTLVLSETFCVGVTMFPFTLVCLVTWPLSGSEVKVDSLDTNLTNFLYENQRSYAN